MRWLSGTLALLLVAAGAYYYFAYPPMVLARATQHALDDFSAAVATRDRPKIGTALGTLLTDSAQVRLEVSFFSLSQMGGGKPQVQEFDKASFITFVDNILGAVLDN